MRLSYLQPNPATNENVIAVTQKIKDSADLQALSGSGDFVFNGVYEASEGGGIIFQTTNRAANRVREILTPIVGWNLGSVIDYPLLELSTKTEMLDLAHALRDYAPIVGWVRKVVAQVEALPEDAQTGLEFEEAVHALSEGKRNILEGAFARLHFIRSGRGAAFIGGKRLDGVISGVTTREGFPYVIVVDAREQEHCVSPYCVRIEREDDSR